MSEVIPRGYHFTIAQQQWIPIPLLRDGALYVIDARNAIFGVWQQDTRGFKIARPYFARRMEGNRMTWYQHTTCLFEEFHWDIGGEDPGCGTARPLVFVEEVPEADKTDLLNYLMLAGQRIGKDDAYKLILTSLCSLNNK